MFFYKCLLSFFREMFSVLNVKVVVKNSIIWLITICYLPQITEISFLFSYVVILIIPD